MISYQGILWPVIQNNPTSELPGRFSPSLPGSHIMEPLIRCVGYMENTRYMGNSGRQRSVGSLQNSRAANRHSASRQQVSAAVSGDCRDRSLPELPGLSPASEVGHSTSPKSSHIRSFNSGKQIPNVIGHVVHTWICPGKIKEGILTHSQMDRWCKMVMHNGRHATSV